MHCILHFGRVFCFSSPCKHFTLHFASDLILCYILHFDCRLLSIFIGTRCTWGPIYGSGIRCQSVCEQMSEPIFADWSSELGGQICKYDASGTICFSHGVRVHCVMFLFLLSLQKLPNLFSLSDCPDMLLEFSSYQLVKVKCPFFDGFELSYKNIIKSFEGIHWDAKKILNSVWFTMRFYNRHHTTPYSYHIGSKIIKFWKIFLGEKVMLIDCILSLLND